MSYCTIDDIRKSRIPNALLLQLTDDDHVGVVNASVVAAAIAEADEIIDGYLRGRYALPMVEPPRILTAISADLATHALYGRRAEFETPARIIESQKNAYKLLTQIAGGTIQLGVAAAPAAATTTSGAEFVAPGRIFDRDSLGGM